MHLKLAEEDLEFKRRASQWLSSNAPTTPRPPEGPAMRSYDLAWIRRQWDAGWGGISWPKEFGGAGLTPLQQMLWYEAYAESGAPPIGVGMVGLNFGGPTLFNCGTPEQCRRHLPGILEGQLVWCQGFSEPQAGSDLAGLSTIGVVHSDHLEITGQKIWTSYADLANFQLLLVRTDAAAAKHRGLTMVICDMASEGIEIRPIRLMSGESHFCEVFYDSVRVPLDNVIGEVGGGWEVAMATLGFERGAAFVADQVALARKVEDLVSMAACTPWPTKRQYAIDDDEISRGLAMLRAQVSGLRAMTYTDVARRNAGLPPGPEGSMTKLYYADIGQSMHRLAFRILGDDALAFNYGDVGWSRDYFYSYAMSIGGGTSEIQKEIISRRILGLPTGRNS